MFNEQENPNLENSNHWVLTALADKLEETRKTHQQLHDSSGKAIAALTDTVRENQKTELELIRANSKAIGDLIKSVEKIQDHQMSMAQMMAEKQYILKQFQVMIDNVMDRSATYQETNSRQIQELAQEMLTLQKQFLRMQQEVFAILETLRKD